jgi:dipeptidyl aminopeptidase/acylaminoacyl peptidase
MPVRLVTPLLHALAVRFLPLAFLLVFETVAAGQSGYQKPPKNVSAILDAPATPKVLVSPARDRLLLLHEERYPPIADLAEPMLRLAGLRINPNTNGPARPPRLTGLTLQTIADGKQIKVALPAGANLSTPLWSPDGRRFAFTNTTATGIELWVSGLEGKVGRLPGVKINAAYLQPPQQPGQQSLQHSVQWVDETTLLCQTVVADRGPPPAPPRVPKGPTIQESSGKVSPARTFPDLLQNAHDEDLFDYYVTSQLVRVQLASASIAEAKPQRVGKPAVISKAVPSPDGKYLLVVRNRRPYSYLLPATAFPKEVEVWDQSGKVIRTLASLPLADQVLIEGVPTGPRKVQWRPTDPATLVWAEALDGGNPKKKVPHRDRLLTWKAPFEGEPAEWHKTEHRFQDLTWGEKGGLVLVRDYERERRWRRTFVLNADEPARPPRLLWGLSAQDRYKDPGTPVLRRLGRGGQRVLWQHKEFIYVLGQGATPQGDRPFLDQLDLNTFQTKRLFQSAEKTYEKVVALLSEDASRFLTQYETPTEPVNYFVHAAETKQALTHFTDPVPQLRGIKKQLVTYKRADGVPLSFTLYLPADYKEGQRLPAVLWAYPREYNDAGTAGQVSGSPYRFTTLNGISHLFFLTQGYAILDGATMPVIGDPETVNNSYIEQIVASAKAAIDKADSLGVIDRKRVGVGGHSYGAFMTANLLAHSDLFRAGIARSGAYNRTLTPFGFQSERRTLWEAPDVYLKMSPFMYAHKIKQPLLLIHGAADNNPGTFPIQSERMYQAIKGNGGTVRFVSLPHESHAYLARESVEHTLYEMIAWFDRHVKNAPEKGPVSAESQR